MKEIADERDVTPARPAIAWGPARGENLVPIPGTKRRAYLEQNAAAAGIALPEDDLAPIDTELPEAAGERYDEAGMRTVSLLVADEAFGDRPRVRLLFDGRKLRSRPPCCSPQEFAETSLGGICHGWTHATSSGWNSVPGPHWKSKRVSSLPSLFRSTQR